MATTTTTNSKRVSASAFLAMMGLMMMIFIESSTAAVPGLRRGIEVDDNERDLQADPALGDFNVVELLESQALPAISGALDTVLSQGNYNPLVMGPQEVTITNKDIPDINGTGLAGGLLSGFLSSCNVTATIIFEGANIYGVQNLTVSSVELVDGSQEVELDFTGLLTTSLVAANWSAIFTINVTTPELSAVTADSLAISADVCGIPMNQAVSASVYVSNPSISVTLRVFGETENLQEFEATSVVSGAVVESVEIVYDYMVADVMTAGSLGETSTNYTVLPQNGTDPISGFTPLLVPLLQSSLDEQLPFATNGQIAISRVP